MACDGSLDEGDKRCACLVFWLVCWAVFRTGEKDQNGIIGKADRPVI